MNEKVISFKTAKLAKEKNFNISVIKFYTPKGYLDYAEDYQTERLASSNWNNGFGSYPTEAEKVECSAPTQSLLQKWLREVYDLFVWVFPENNGGTFGWEIDESFKDKYKELPDGEYDLTGYNYKTYEEALEKGLREALKLIK